MYLYMCVYLYIYTLHFSNDAFRLLCKNQPMNHVNPSGNPSMKVG